MQSHYIAIEPIVTTEPVCDSDRRIYWADEVDKRIAELQYQYREMFLLRGIALNRIDELKEQLNDRRKGGE
jgi:hypothetical protein